LNNIDSYNEFLNTFPYSSDVEDVIDRVLKIQLSQITDDSIKTIVKNFCKIDEISKIALLKTENFKGNFKEIVDTRTVFYTSMKGANVEKSKYLHQIIGIMEDNNTSKNKSLSACRGLEEMIKRIDLDKLKSVKGNSEEEVFKSIGEIYLSYFYNGAQKLALGYINNTYDQLKNSILKVFNNSKDDSIKEFSAKFLPLFE
jgi:hypothetical protein